ncbi:hypothetical protein [Acidovorax sp. LjRoot117]|uniref:hypothetical protein n=1 Tax=Acidovorax sp. LjRoot117 TaxID=3342255 RepID=UPI003ED0B466
MLTSERIRELWENYSPTQGIESFARAVEAATLARVTSLVQQAERYRMLRRGQHWSVVDGIGNTLRAEDLDAAIDAVLARNAIERPMVDKELLELAAKAAGQERSAAGDLWSNAQGQLWNPLLDDRDAWRLAMRLHLDIEQSNPLDNTRYVSVSRCGIEMVHGPVRVTEEFEDESGRNDATRRAIVRAAAEIGRAMP